MNLLVVILSVLGAYWLIMAVWATLDRWRDRRDPRARLDTWPAPGARAQADTVITEARVTAEFRRLKNLLAPEYAITLEFKPLERFKGQAFIVPGRFAGEVRIDLARHTGFADVQFTLIHEITHILNEPFLSYRLAITGGTQSATEQVAWHVATEHATDAVTHAIVRTLNQRSEP
jgi:hypothetical protein